MDSDNKIIHLNLNNTSVHNAILDLDFKNNNIINDVIYSSNGIDTRVEIKTNVVYYAETFFLKEKDINLFKIVIDVFRQKEPYTILQANEYIKFYDKVGYIDRANEIRRRLNAGQYVATQQQTETFITITPTAPPPPPPTFVPTTIIQNPVLPPLRNDSFSGENPLQYLKPDDIYLTTIQQNWINEAFRIYDVFKEIHTQLEQAERTLKLYDAQTTVGISFVDSMSRSYNTLSDVNIYINEVRLNFLNLQARINFEINSSVEYTRTMIAHVLSTLDSYQSTTMRLQNEFSLRQNR
jgi:hypothetical protein